MYLPRELLQLVFSSCECEPWHTVQSKILGKKMMKFLKLLSDSNDIDINFVYCRLRQFRLPITVELTIHKMHFDITIRWLQYCLKLAPDVLHITTTKINLGRILHHYYYYTRIKVAHQTGRAPALDYCSLFPCQMVRRR